MDLSKYSTICDYRGLRLLFIIINKAVINIHLYIFAITSLALLFRSSMAEQESMTITKVFKLILPNCPPKSSPSDVCTLYNTLSSSILRSIDFFNTYQHEQNLIFTMIIIALITNQAESFSILYLLLCEYTSNIFPIFK